MKMMTFYITDIVIGLTRSTATRPRGRFRGRNRLICQMCLHSRIRCPTVGDASYL